MMAVWNIELLGIPPTAWVTHSKGNYSAVDQYCTTQGDISENDTDLQHDVTFVVSTVRTSHVTSLQTFVWTWTHSQHNTTGNNSRNVIQNLQDCSEINCSRFERLFKYRKAIIVLQQDEQTQVSVFEMRIILASA